MPSGKAGISGVAVGAAAAGGILVYAGIQNTDLLTALRALIRGKPIPKGPQSTYSPTAHASYVAGKAVGSNATTLIGATVGLQIVSIAASMKGTKYVFGGGHGGFCSGAGLDCSGFVSCVLHKANLLQGHPLTTDGFAKWGDSVPFAQREPGDLVIWVGGPGGGHMGIVADSRTMWHNPCTGCGGVQKGSYGRTRTGRPTIVRRVHVG